MAEQLTELQRVVLEVEARGLTVRDSIKQVSAQVGFFVGQQKYREELERARQIVGVASEEAGRRRRRARRNARTPLLSDPSLRPSRRGRGRTGQIERPFGYTVRL